LTDLDKFASIIHMENSNTETIVKEEGMRVYELGYLLVPTISEENLASEVGILKDALETFSAVTISEEYPKLIELAYKMNKVIANKKNKFDTGYFGWIKFEVEVSVLAGIKEKLDKSDSIIRYLLIKTIRENTIASKRPVRNDLRKRNTKKDGESADTPALEMNKEEVDKKIDELIVAE